MKFLIACIILLSGELCTKQESEGIMAIQVMTREEHEAMHTFDRPSGTHKYLINSPFKYRWHRSPKGDIYTSPDYELVKIHRNIDKTTHKPVYLGRRVNRGKVETHPFRTLNEAKYYCEKQYLVYFLPDVDAKPVYQKGYPTKEIAIESLAGSDKAFFGLELSDILVELFPAEASEPRRVKWLF